MSDCSRQHLQYFYNASAYGLAGEIDRPMRYSIPAQAATTLAGSGGRGFQRIENFSVTPFVSFDAAYTEVGGSFDDCHNQYTTFAYSVIEGLNIAGMVTADRVVARMAVYSPIIPAKPASGDAQEAAAIPRPNKKRGKSSAPAVNQEHTFDITGSYFENLRIAGYKIDVQLGANPFHQLHTYNSLSHAMTNGADAMQPWGGLDNKRAAKLEELEGQYHALTGFGSRARQWNTNRQQRRMGDMFWCSAAGHYDLHKEFPKTELQGFGGIICIPKFGVVRLAEVVIHKDRRQLHMLRVDMCSTSSGGIVGGGAGGGGSMPPPP